MLRFNPPKNKDECRRKDIWRKLCNFVLLSIFNGNGEVFKYFGFFLSNILKRFKIVRLCDTDRLYLNKPLGIQIVLINKQ